MKVELLTRHDTYLEKIYFSWNEILNIIINLKYIIIIIISQNIVSSRKALVSSRKAIDCVYEY